MTRKILVTGASSGIGQAICDKMIDLGHHVIGITRDKSKLKLRKNNFTSIELDLSHLDKIPAVIGETLQTHSEIDGMVSCAGRGEFASLEEFSYAQISQFVELNLISHIYLTRAMVPHLKQKNRGDIIFIGSDAALQGSKKGSLYCACKFALRGLAQSLRAECATSHVRVAIIQPGMTDTAFYDDLHFSPGAEPHQHLLAQDVADVAALIIEAREGTVFDEIHVSPLTKIVNFKKNSEKT